uniref:Uncharacterized protein n=1 Tax=Timema tahoe TaxID=61484 RepID=A0A7R9FJU4_9NEOP|nr:unnamed protein product [Timema tahoe]
MLKHVSHYGDINAQAHGMHRGIHTATPAQEKYFQVSRYTSVLITMPRVMNTLWTPVGTPEKKDDKKVVEKKVVEKKVEEVDEDSKASENGDLDKPKENGTSDEKDSSEDSKDKDAESNENGDSTESCPVKRKSGAGDAPDGTLTEGASPEKKAKLEEKPAAEEKAEANGKEEVAA